MWLDDTTHRAVLEQSENSARAADAGMTVPCGRCTTVQCGRCRHDCAVQRAVLTLTTRHTERCWNSVVQGENGKEETCASEERRREREDAMEGKQEEGRK